MLVISYGMPKSASTFIWQMTNNLIRKVNNPDAFKAEGILSNNRNFINNSELEEFLVADYPRIPKDFFYLIKTHAPLSSKSKSIIENSSDIVCICNVRDPYDNMVALLDAGIRERKRELAVQKKAFAKIETLDNALRMVKFSVTDANKWIDLEDKLVLTFLDIKYSPLKVLLSIRNLIGLEVADSEVESIVLSFQDKSKIGQFNKGIEGRGYTELDHDLIPEEHKALFSNFIHKLESYKPLQ